jgi:general secretion pathway protein D
MTSDNTWSTRMSFVFGLCALLGILLLIFSEVGLAQGNGFRPGGAPIGNPLNDPGGDDEFDEFDDFDAPPPPRTRGKAGRRGSVADDSFTGGISVGGAPEDKSVPSLNRGKKGLELSGPGTEKNIVSKNEVPALFVDNESGSGDAADREMITDFNFPDADIMDIAKTLGRLTGKNFILDKDVKGRVSVISNSRITVADAWRAFLTSLDMNGLAIVPTGKYLRIMRQNDAKGKNVRLYSSTKAPNTDALVTKIFKIKFISAKELENVIRTYANMGARIYGFEQTNTLIITDTGSNIDKIAKMIQFLDVEGFDAGIEVISVKFASAVEIQKLIDSLLPGTQAAFPGRPGFGGGGGSRSNFAARRTKEGGLINNIIADERTNTLIVHANPKGVEQVRALISRLDRKMPQAIGGGKVHVVYLQFADAEDMAKTLKDISQSGRSSGSPGFSSGGGGGGLGINPNEGALFEGQIKISPDKTTNSLVITSSPNDFGTIQRVINKLDIPRDQIYIEVVIMEMNMNRRNDYAANVLLPGGTSVAPTQDLFDWLTNPTKTPSGLVLRARDAGTEVQVPINGVNTPIKIPNLAGLLKAVQTSSNGTILATPQIMTLENTEAVFDSTEKIPIPKITNAGLGVSNVGIEFQDVPLTIKIKPQLNKISNFIKMDIKATVSDATPRGVPEALEKQAFSTTKRSAETSLMIADGDTIVLGGLVRDKASEVINKVPLLGDIPILGWLFKSRSSEVTKNNLMLFITPKIMRQPENVRMVLDRKLKERDEFVERALGGDDQHREVRNNIIRNLPDVKSIKNYNPKKTVTLDEDESKNDSKKDSKEGTLPELMKEDSHETLTLPPADGGAATGPVTAPPVDALPPLPDPNAGGSP